MSQFEKNVEISEIDVELLEKHDEKIMEHFLIRIDNLINLINDDEYLMMKLNPKRDYGDDRIFEKIVYYRVKGENNKIKKLIKFGNHFDIYHIIYIDYFKKFEKQLKENYLRHLNNMIND